MPAPIYCDPLEITRWWQLHATPSGLRNISGSQAEHGPLAGQITWANALTSAESLPELDEDQDAIARSGMKTWGAWDDETIDAWSPLEVRAMIAQMLASSARMWCIYSTTSRTDWPEPDPDTGELPRADWRLLEAREGPPLMYVIAWTDDGMPARVVADIAWMFP